MALVWALTAAVLYGTGAALQQRQAAAAPRRAAGRLRLILLLVRRPWWLLGIGVELGGFATHAVALRTGPLTIEREAGTQRMADVRAAIETLQLIDADL